MVDSLRLYAEAFFTDCNIVVWRPGGKIGKGKKSTVLPKDFFEVHKVENRINPHSGEQWHAGKAIEALTSYKTTDIFCILGVTARDLYPRDEWNFVFGLANLDNACGVFSFCRYSPEWTG